MDALADTLVEVEVEKLSDTLSEVRVTPLVDTIAGCLTEVVPETLREHWPM